MKVFDTQKYREFSLNFSAECEVMAVQAIRRLASRGMSAEEISKRFNHDLEWVKSQIKEEK